MIPHPTKIGCRSNPGPCESDLSWTRGLCRCHQVKMKPLGWTLVQCNWCLYEKREIWTQTHAEERVPSRMSYVKTHTPGNRQVKMEEEAGVMCLRAMEGQQPRAGAGNNPSPASFRGSRALLTPLISDF